MRPLVLLVSLPGWVLVLVAAGIAWTAHADARRQIALTDRIAAIAGEPAPPVTDLVAGRRPATGAVPEVTLRAQTVPGQTLEVATLSVGAVTRRHRVVVLLPPDARQVSGEIAGLIVVPADRGMRLDRWLHGQATGTGAVGSIVELPGWLRTREPTAGLVREALRQRGLAVGPDIVYLDPFVDGRAVALSRWAVQQSTPTTLYYAVATVLALFGAARMARTKLGRPRPEPGPDAPLPDPEPHAPLPVRVMAAACPLPDLTPEEEESLTPFQRIRRREALREATMPPVGLEPTPGPTASPGEERTWLPNACGGIAGRRRLRASRWWWARRPDPFDRLAEEVARL